MAKFLFVFGALADCIGCWVFGGNVPCNPTGLESTDLHEGCWAGTCCSCRNMWLGPGMPASVHSSPSTASGRHEPQRTGVRNRATSPTLVSIASARQSTSEAMPSAAGRCPNRRDADASWPPPRPDTNKERASSKQPYAYDGRRGPAPLQAVAAVPRFPRLTGPVRHAHPELT